MNTYRGLTEQDLDRLIAIATLEDDPVACLMDASTTKDDRDSALRLLKAFMELTDQMVVDTLVDSAVLSDFEKQLREDRA